MEQQVRMRRALRPALVAALSMALFTVNGQEACDPPTDKKVLKALESAGRTKDGRERHALLKELYEEHGGDCGPCTYQLALSAYDRARAGSGSFATAAGYLEEVRAKCPTLDPALDYFLGGALAGDGRKAEAMAAFQRFLDAEPPKDAKGAELHRDRVREVEGLLPEMRFLAEFYRDDRELVPKVLKGVSTAADEYLPMFSPDNELLFFTRISKYQAKGDLFARDVEELTEARRKSVNIDFDGGAALKPPFNTGDSYGGVTVSLNNKELFVTVCKPVGGGYKNCDLYRSHFDTHMDFGTGKQVFEWSELESLGPEVNTPDGWESQPTLSADGKTLYFATVRAGSRGTDIYQTTRDAIGKWGRAVPVPGPINTDGDEKAPFMHTDSRTMYFAARPPRDDKGREDVGNGHRGIGGYDIFYSRMDDAGNWSKPKNIGHPINTQQDDHGLIVSADGRTAYFASSRFKGVGGLDIYGFDLPVEARPEDVMIVKGEVKDADGKVVTDAEVSITYMDSRRTEKLKVDKADGRYAAVVSLKAGADVVVTVKKPDHVFDSRVFTVADTARGGVATADMEVAPIAVGKTYRVNDINYATNSAEITKASMHILDELIVFLKENPTVRIEIQGHTDNAGNLERNMVLSNDRAFTVKQHLEAKGIKASRLTSKGFGPTKPIADNGTEQGRARNRRTEFLVTGR